MKKRSPLLLLILVTGMGVCWFLAANPLTPCNAQTPIKILTASATSSSDDSLPVVDLLDPAKEGFWRPNGPDSGTNEGLFFQFQTPTLIDRIEVKVKNGKGNYRISYYLDGKMNVPAPQKGASGKKNVEESGPELEYAVNFEDMGLDRLFILGARNWTSEGDSFIPLNVKAKSLFIKIDSAGPGAGIVSIRFFRANQKEPLLIQAPLVKKGSISATSTLEPKTAYNILNLFDSRLDFAWATDGKTTNGVGESFTVNLDQPQSLSGLIVWNGYQRSEIHYQANSRPAKFKIKINGEDKWSLQLKDQMGSQMLLFPEPVAEVNSISVMIDKIFPGTKYKDLVISEIRMIDKTENVIILDTPVPNIEVSTGILKKVLDVSLGPCLLGILSAKEPLPEYFDSAFDAAINYPHNSIRIRSNGSFVCYSEFGQIMEGNWEPISNGVRIFGKKYRTDYYSSLYLQEVKAGNAVSIFQANIEILDPAQLSESQMKKYLKPVLASRRFYDELTKKKPPYDWWLGVKPYGKVKATGTNEEELIKKISALAAKEKAILLSSNLFTDIFLPEDQIRQVYDFEP